MELNIKFNEKMLAETANRVLDEYKYNGKTIREWADLIANPKTNADRIRSMSNEELAGKFEEVQLTTVKAYGYDDGLLAGELRKYWLDWLKQEAEGDAQS